MPEVTSLSPASSNKNTGTAGVKEILQKVTGLVFGPAGEVIALADRADARTFIQEKLLEDNKDDRWYVIGPMGEVTNNSKEGDKITWAYGAEYIINNGKTILRLYPETTDERVLDQMQSFNNANKGILIFHENGVLHGTTDGSTGVKFLTLGQAFAGARAFDTGEGHKPYIDIVLANNNEINNSNNRTWKIDFDITTELTRMNTLTLSQATAVNSSRIVDIKVMCGSTNFADMSQANLLAVTGAWKGTTTAGAAIAATAVSIVQVGGENVYRVTYSSTNYPTSGNTFEANLVVPSLLAALSSPLVGFESEDGLTQTAA